MITCSAFVRSNIWPRRSRITRRWNRGIETPCSARAPSNPRWRSEMTSARSSRRRRAKSRVASSPLATSMRSIGPGSRTNEIRLGSASSRAAHTSLVRGDWLLPQFDEELSRGAPLRRIREIPIRGDEATQTEGASCGEGSGILPADQGDQVAGDLEIRLQDEIARGQDVIPEPGREIFAVVLSKVSDHLTDDAVRDDPTHLPRRQLLQDPMGIRSRSFEAEQEHVRVEDRPSRHPRPSGPAPGRVEDFARPRRPRRIPSRRGGNGGDNRRECKRCGSLYVGTLSLSNPVDSEDASSRRFAAAGAVLVGGLLFGLVLSSLFRWSPYYWQWLAYNNGPVAAVLTDVLMSATDDAPRSRGRPPTAQVRIRAANTADVESTL